MKKKLYQRWYFWVVLAFFLAAIGSSLIEEEDSEPAKEPSAEHGVSKEYQNALYKAEFYSETYHLSEKGVYDRLVSEYAGQFEEDAAQYAMENLEADWNANALAKAKSYQDTYHMSKNAIYDRLTSDYGGFTEEQAQFAIDNLE